MSFGKNWKTSIGGILLGLPSLLTSTGVVDPTNKYAALISVVGAVWLGFTAKDSNVTGGTVAQETTVIPRITPSL